LFTEKILAKIRHIQTALVCIYAVLPFNAAENYRKKCRETAKNLNTRRKELISAQWNGVLWMEG